MRILIINRFIFQNDTSRRSGSPNTSAESRSRRETSRNGAHDWQLDEALKRTRNSTMMSVLSDSEHQSDSEKPQVKEEPEKPKPPDVRKRGRPRKSVKSPKANNHRASDENMKNVTKRSRPRAGSSVGGVTSLKKKVPTSKPTLTTSDDASDARSPAVSSDSESDRPSTIPSASAVKIPVKRRSRLSISSNDENNASDKNSGSDEESSRWRRVSMKRNKIPESPKKQQDKKKSPTKNNPRRPRSRVTNNNSGYRSESDSDSEFTNSEAVRNNRIQVIFSSILKNSKHNISFSISIFLHLIPKLKI